MAEQVTYESGNNPVHTIMVRASATRTKGDLSYLDMDEYGFTDQNEASDAEVHRVIVALQSAASGEWYQACWKGECSITVASATYTAGHGLEVDGGVIEDSGAAFNAKGVQGEAITDFGVVKTTVTGTTVVAVLHGEAFTSTT